jgi:hypothetical protein
MPTRLKQQSERAKRLARAVSGADRERLEELARELAERAAEKEGEQEGQHSRRGRPATRQPPGLPEP